jgi:hypothetical protein
MARGGSAATAGTDGRSKPALTKSGAEHHRISMYGRSAKSTVTYAALVDTRDRADATIALVRRCARPAPDGVDVSARSAAAYRRNP